MCSKCREPFLNIQAFDKHLGGTPSRRKPCHQPTALGMVKIQGRWAQPTEQKD